jgi:hypothetical protein
MQDNKKKTIKVQDMKPKKDAKGGAITTLSKPPPPPPLH